MPVVNTGVAHHGLELVCVPVQPGHHVSAVTAPGGRHPIFVDPGLFREPIRRLQQVRQRLVPHRAGDRVRELLAVSARPVEIHTTDDIPLGGPQLEIPAKAPVVGDAAVRAAVHDLHEWPFLGRVEVRRVDDPLLDVLVAGSLEGLALDLAELPLALEGIIEMFERDRVLESRSVRDDGGRPVEAALQIDSETPASGEVDRSLGDLGRIRKSASSRPD